MKVSKGELKKRATRHLLGEGFSEKDITIIRREVRGRNWRGISERGWLIEFFLQVKQFINDDDFVPEHMAKSTMLRKISTISRKVQKGSLLEGASTAEAREIEKTIAKKARDETERKKAAEWAKGAEKRFIEKMAKTLPKTMVQASIEAKSKNMVEEKVLLLKIWSGWGKPSEKVKLTEAEQAFITKCLDDFQQDEKVLAGIQRCKEFHDLAPGLERFAYKVTEYKKTKAVWERIHNVLPHLLEVVALEQIELEEAEKLIDLFGDVPDAIMEILDGADYDAVALKYDRLQL